MKRKRQSIEKVSQYEVSFCGFTKEDVNELTDILKDMIEESVNVSDAMGLKAFPVYVRLTEDYEHITPLKMSLVKVFDPKSNLKLVQGDTYLDLLR